MTIPIHEMLRRIRPLALHHQAAYLSGQIASERGKNKRRTSVRLREMEAALADVQMRRLKRERRMTDPVHRTTEPASAPIGHHRAEIASA